jgi:hypothetical protein
MSKIIRNKEQINATVTPYLKKKCMEIAEGPDFTSISDVVSQALSEFIIKYDEKKSKETKKHQENVSHLFICTLLKTQSGQDFLESIYESNSNLFCENEELENYTNSKFLEMLKTKYTSDIENLSYKDNIDFRDSNHT